jgi:hypothetical protein
MDGYFSSSFLRGFPKKVEDNFLGQTSAFTDLLLSIERGCFQVESDSIVLNSVMEQLKEERPLIFNKIQGLISSGKINFKSTADSIAEELMSIQGVPKSVLKQLSNAFILNTDFLIHSSFQNAKWREKILESTGKALLVDEDIKHVKTGMLFKETSFPFNIGDEFRWAEFLDRLIYPYLTIRVLDPYLYTNLNECDINNLLRQIARLSDPNKLTIQLISDLSPRNSKFTSEEIIEKLKDKVISAFPELNITCYDQRNHASNVFHKRVIWTDFWVLKSDRGFDFLDRKDNSKSFISRENDLLLTGKYASRSSIWHQVKDIGVIIYKLVMK